jgi:hypothetical protein
MLAENAIGDAAKRSGVRRLEGATPKSAGGRPVGGRDGPDAPAPMRPDETHCRRAEAAVIAAGVWPTSARGRGDDTR